MNVSFFFKGTFALFPPALKRLLSLCRRISGRRLVFDVCGERHVSVQVPETGKAGKEPDKTVPARKSRNLMRDLGAFLTARYRFRFNLLTEEAEVARLDAAATVPARRLLYEKLDERSLNSLSMDAMEAGLPCWDRDVLRFVRSDRVADFHPFSDYFSNLPRWDGIDRVLPLAQRVSGDKVWVDGFHRWLLATVAQWMEFDMQGRANSVAPLLVSPTQGMGKSTFCRLLLPEELKAYYTESFDLAAPSTAEAKLAAYGLINLDEFDRLGVSKMPLLKSLMQTPALNVRKAYKRSASSLHRIASFIGTSNRKDLLVDGTGNRRFLCVDIRHTIDCGTSLDHRRLYAQLRSELLSGERHWFSKEEEAAIQRNNALFCRHVPEEEVFRLCFRFVRERDEDGGAMGVASTAVEQLTAAQIYEEMKKQHPAAMRGMTAYSLSRVLPQLGERLHTSKGNVYEVVRA